MPHLLVPDLLQALHSTPATRVLTLNVSLTDDEAAGYTVAGHVEAILQHAPGLTFDHVIADPQVVSTDAERAAEAAEAGAASVSFFSTRIHVEFSRL